ncbi:MAG: hypothetical protein K8R86_03015 [Bacteroidales bacterium]|nr:hypothetical protein [Bacteroidales bacterium]
MLKRKLLIYILFTLFFFNSSFGQGLIIDHNCTNVDLIPTTVVDNIKSECKFEWAGASHAHQLLAGLKFLENDFPYLDVTIGDGETGDPNGGYLPDANGTFCIMDGVTLLWSQCGKCCYQFIAPEAYWLGDDAHQTLEKTLVTCFPNINISGWEWCTELNTWTAAQVQEYLNQMSAYELQYPNVQFIYTTGTAEYNGDAGYNRYLRNNQIRQYCIQNNKVLFDFADLDCWSNGEMNYYLHINDTIPLLHGDYYGTYYHTNEIGCKNKAKAVWYMMARLQSWKPDSIRLNLKLYLEGPFTGTVMNTNLNNQEYLPLSQPYNMTPWNYNGLENVPVIPNSYIVDWVLIELRDAVDASLALPQNALSRKAAFLVNNGYIVDMDGYSNIVIESKFDDNLYAIIWHRNHLGVMSANPLSFYDGAYQYDFSYGSAQAYGDSLAHKPITPVLWGLASGNGNADSIINISDKTEIWQIQAGMDGYLESDFNLDGQVNTQDKNENWMENFGTNCQVPQ